MSMYTAESEDRLIYRAALQTVGIMQSTGNYKKSVTHDELIDSVYRPLVPTAEEAKKERVVSDDPEYAKEFVKQLEQKIQTQ